MATKRLIPLLFLCYSGFTLFAQAPVTILYNEKPAGKNLISNRDIRAEEHFFPERIDKYYLDATTGLLTLQLRGKSENGNWLKNTGKVVLYDLTSKEVKWIKRMNYLQSNILQYDNMLIQTKANATYRLNLETGKNQWQVANQISYIDPVTGIGIGYPYSASVGYSKRLEGIDLSRGNLVWYREINREYGWNDILPLNDSVILLVAAGLHTINLKNGGGWEYSTITGANDYTGTIIANTVGITLGLLTGFYTIYTGHNVVTDVTSNVWMDSTNLYFASREKIAGLQLSGNELWSSPLPKHKASKSSIFTTDSLIYLVNFGYAFMGYHQTNFGVPFIAAFNKQSGRQVFLTEINGKEGRIADYLSGNNEILLLFKNSVARYSMHDGSLISETAISTETTGDLKIFTGEELYVEADSVYLPLSSYDPAKIFVVTEKNKMLILDEKFEILDTTDLEQFYTLSFSRDGLKFLGRDKEIIVVNHENKKIAEIEASPKAFLIGTKLYDIQEKSFLEFDLSGLLGESSTSR